MEISGGESMRFFWGRFIFSVLVLPLLLLVFFNENVHADVVASPTSIQFYVVKEQPSNPSPVTLSAFSTTATTASSNSSTGGTTINTNQTECMLATTSAPWITVSPGTCASVTPGSANTFNVGIDITKLPIYSGTAVTGSTATSYTGTITLTDELETSENSSTSGTGSGTSTGLTPNGSTTVSVTVYITSLRDSTGETTLNTSDWLDLTMDIPITKNMSGALYVLAEHKDLPGQVFAYRYDPTNGPRFDYFSQWGQMVPNAGSLYYAADVQNTPIAIPFTTSPTDNTIPYGWTDVVSTIPVRFGAGMRLIGLEGDIVIHVLVGDSSNPQNWQSWRELLYYVLHVEPVTGTWTVTEYYNGQPYTYTNYPLFLYEKRGTLSGQWIDPHGQIPLTVSYANPTDQVCTGLTASGQINLQGCDMKGGYQIYFNEPSVFGTVEYLYNISGMDIGGGSLSGEYTYRMLGDTAWSIPETFDAVRQEVVIPLNATTNSYLVGGTVNGYAVQFVVDTGANQVVLDQSIAPYIGIDLTNTTQCPSTGTVTVAGGGTIQVTYCNVSNITVQGLSKNNVQAAFTTQPGPAILGMSFLDTFHISTDAADGTMTIAP